MLVPTDVGARCVCFAAHRGEGPCAVRVYFSAAVLAGAEEERPPFFIAACDYTLIGEELYAASAYLSQDPVLLGPLKAQDWTKIVIVVLVIISVILATIMGHNPLTQLIHAV